MDRLMCLHVQSCTEAVELWVNGLPVMRLPAGGTAQTLTVHEYLQAGANRLTLVVAPSPLLQAAGAPAAVPRLAPKPLQVQARLLLLRSGKRVADGSARVLAELNWHAAEGQAFDAPTIVNQELELPVAFPRWRWLDAPAITFGPAERALALAFVQRCCFELSRGNPDGLIAASRLKYEELGQAYQVPEAELVGGLRDQVQALWKSQALAKLVPPTAESLLLRPVAAGRLIECLNLMGEPALRTQNDDPKLANAAWPLRLTIMDGKVYVLR